MHTIYGKGYSEEDRKGYKTIVYNNVITSMKTLCAHVQNYGQVLPENEATFNFMLTDIKDDVVDEQVGGMIQNLWDDPAIKLTFDHRADFQLTDSAEYFFNKVHEIMQKNYLPTQQDVLRSRVRTTGIVESTFEIKGCTFRMYDVGGQRNERKKWIHCFENVTAVLFVAAMSEYDQVLYEDETMNRLEEALTLFAEISGLSWFRNSPIILFLNKRDLFNHKVEVARIPLSKYFPTFTGADYDSLSAQTWICEQFKARCKKEKAQLYSHITCATDTDNVRPVFDDVTAMFIVRALQDSGLM